MSAAAPDGVIEAFEDVSPSRWWVAMQFHPEWSTHLSWVMGLFTAFVDASRAYSSVPREEMEPLRAEMRDWLRQRDRSLPRRGATSTLGIDTPLTPVTRHPSNPASPSQGGCVVVSPRSTERRKVPMQHHELLSREGAT